MMDITSPESRDRLRQELIDEINSLDASTRALKSRRNELAAISRLPCEVLAALFSFLSAFAWDEGSGLLAWICVAHVCRQWRETALSHPRFWSRINLTELTPVGMAEILSRAKIAPLHLEADFTEWEAAHFEVFERQLEAHISHIRHLNFSGVHLSTVVKRLVSSAPTLESLSLSHESPLRMLPFVIIPDNLLNCAAPNLTSLKLEKCNINWKSPLLKGLRTLEILDLSPKARPKLNDWLDALNEMPQLTKLTLRSATPRVCPSISRTITLPSLTYLRIDDSAENCGLALAHLVLPTLTWLHVNVESHNRDGGDVLRTVIPYVVQCVHVMQDIEPIRSILIAGERKRTEVLTWTTPGADVKVCDLDTLSDMSGSACLQFSATSNSWCYGVDNAIFDELLSLLPMNSVSTLSAQNCTRLSKKSWLKHASNLHLLEQARLVPTAVKAFRGMLAEDTPVNPDGPRLPMLTKLILLDVNLNKMRTLCLRDILIERVEQGVPLEYLDLRTCVAADRTIQLLAEIVVDVQEPLDTAPEEFFGWQKKKKGSEYYNEVRFDDDAHDSWYDNMDDSEDEDEDEGETDYGDGVDFIDDLHVELDSDDEGVTWTWD